MDFDSINYFLYVCKTGSFSEAAKELYISQPTLSRRIIALEDELCTALFERKSTGISLTPGGKLFYSEQSKIMERQSALLSKMRCLQAEQAGTLAIGCRVKMPMDYIIRAVLVMKVKYPNVEVSIREMSSEQLADSYATDKIDIAYNRRAYLDENYSGNIETIQQTEPLILIPRNHKLFGAEHLDFSDLQGERFVLMRRGQGIQKYTISLFEKLGISLKDAITCDTNTERLALAALYNCLAIGGSTSPDEYITTSEFFGTATIPSTGINMADLCAAYHPSNIIAARFIKYVHDAVNKNP